jgi:hypothetical protein
MNFDSLTFNSTFQTTWVVDGYQLKMPSALVVAIQSGDYAGRCEMFLNKKLTVEFWFYAGVINM